MKLDLNEAGTSCKSQLSGTCATEVNLGKEVPVLSRSANIYSCTSLISCHSLQVE